MGRVMLCKVLLFVWFPCRIFTIYTRTLPLDVACRVWDMFCRDGDSFLFRTAVGTSSQSIVMTPYLSWFGWAW